MAASPTRVGPGGAGKLLIAPFPIDDIPKRPAIEIGAQIVAEEIDGAMTVLITCRRDVRRDQYPGIRPEASSISSATICAPISRASRSGTSSIGNGVIKS